MSKYASCQLGRVDRSISTPRASVGASLPVGAARNWSPTYSGCNLKPQRIWRKLLLPGRYLRLQPEIEGRDLDDVDHLDELKSLAARDFALRSEEIVKNLKVPR